MFSFKVGDFVFLTKSGFRKILKMGILYFLIGSICIVSWAIFNSIYINDKFLLILGIFAYLLGVIFVFSGRYVEGKGKLINLGNKLVRSELKPAEFIEHYELLKNSDELLINKPSIEVLQLLVLAYDLLDQRQKALETVEEMISIASEKKKAFANLFKVSLMFSYDKKDDAEVLFNEIQRQKLDFMSKALVDAILKSDRAMALCDYKTAETYNLNMLQRTFPKLDNLSKLIIHYKLGEVYEKLQQIDKAIAYYKYCVDFGGETAIKVSAVEKLQEIN